MKDIKILKQSKYSELAAGLFTGFLLYEFMTVTGDFKNYSLIASCVILIAILFTHALYFDFEIRTQTVNTNRYAWRRFFRGMRLAVTALILAYPVLVIALLLLKKASFPGLAYALVTYLIALFEYSRIFVKASSPLSRDCEEPEEL